MYKSIKKILMVLLAIIVFIPAHFRRAFVAAIARNRTENSMWASVSVRCLAFLRPETLILQSQSRETSKRLFSRPKWEKRLSGTRSKQRR